MEDEDDLDDGTVMGGILSSVKMEGYPLGSPEFEKRKCQLQVAKCREMRGLTSCIECPAADFCELYIRVKRDSRGIE